MKHLHFASLVVGTLGIALSPSTEAQRPTPRPKPQPVVTHTLAQARSIFSRSDANKDSRISLAESRAMGVSPAEFGSFDTDGDALVGNDEFLVGYRNWVSSAGQKVAPDLDAEATRLQALRKAKEAEQKRKRAQDAEKGARPVSEGPAARRSGGTETSVM